ncbi:hypothetical protein [Treponema endosymbiont of Eucomonympha sp.]|uniref:hypothetical protein n=1 Tax=Treponema endosymbiont of Eucomonympha sp. TaxID=1580831 RepID=UPI000750835C|nr:hypothetical protein [Treponema endosymbiont of Eucomonympha sp.]
MENEQFDALLPVIVAALAVKIFERQQLTQEDAIARLYASEVYAAFFTPNAGRVCPSALRV